MERVSVVSFDCYGTLIRWREGLSAMMNEVLQAAGRAPDGGALLTAFTAAHIRETQAPYRPYKEVLRRSLEQAATECGLSYADSTGDRLIAVVPTFPAHDDVAPGLSRVRTRFKTALISNTDDDLIEGSLKQIGVPFDWVITAAQARAYKPSPAVFDYALRVMRCTPTEVIHVGLGLRTDIEPAEQLGWPRVWLNRYADQVSVRLGTPVARDVGELVTMLDL